jgi:NAD(P)H-hydrate epimerase
MKWITIEGIREAEKIAFAQRNISSYTTMCRAGAAVAREVETLGRLKDIRHVVVMCGTGNNGGDGLVVARCLKLDGYDVSLLLTTVPAKYKGDAARAWKDVHALGLPVEVIPADGSWLKSAWASPNVSPRRAIIVDALLGIGARGVPSGAVASAIHWINGTSLDCPVVSVDVPSGLDADTGTSPGESVRADITVTFSRPKIGFSNPSAQAWLGNLVVEDVGLPADLLAPYEVTSAEQVELISKMEVRNYLRPERRLDSHKRDYGHTLIIGGCNRYPHAPIFSGLAAYRAGCGLVTLDVPEASHFAAAQWVPEAIFTDKGWLPEDLLKGHNKDADIAFDMRDYDAIVMGPGSGELSPSRMALLKYLVCDNAAPRAVLDADALTALVDLFDADWQADGTTLRLVLTPHPGEAARLLGITTQDVQADRPGAARALAQRFHAIVVLKGHHTLVAAPNGRLRVCMGGNPGMATAGTGDILAGLIGGLLARGLGTEDAVCLGVYSHALAGDKAAFLVGQESLMTTDLFKTLRV